jgi:predicted nucleotidyltransferase component of viral defense system
MINLHEDPVLFREMITYTAAETTFLPRLVEKDYFCTVLLEYLTGVQGLVFKGGTCLAKVHTDFYRLSEDLDLVIPIAVDTNRKERGAAIGPAKEAFKKLTSQLPVFREKEPLKGANKSTQYLAVLEYDSLLARNREIIKLEISLREPLLEPTEPLEARTILLNPASNRQSVPALRLASISKRECYAEKFRAALTRPEPAIRDFFDIDYAVARMNLNPEEKALIALVQRKLAVPGNILQELNEERLRALGVQLETELKPVLRKGDYEKFDLDRALRILREMINHTAG